MHMWFKRICQKCRKHLPLNSDGISQEPHHALHVIVMMMKMIVMTMTMTIMMMVVRDRVEQWALLSTEDYLSCFFQMKNTSLEQYYPLPPWTLLICSPVIIWPNLKISDMIWQIVWSRLADHYLCSSRDRADLYLRVNLFLRRKCGILSNVWTWQWSLLNYL